MRSYLPIYLFFHTIHVSFFTLYSCTVSPYNFPLEHKVLTLCLCSFFFPSPQHTGVRLKRFLAHHLKRWVSYMKLEYILHHPLALCASLLNHILLHMHLITHVYTHTHILCRCLCNPMNLQLFAVYCISVVCLTTYKINRVVPVSQLFLVSF